MPIDDSVAEWCAAVQAHWLAGAITAALGQDALAIKHYAIASALAQQLYPPLSAIGIRGQPRIYAGRDLWPEVRAVARMPDQSRRVSGQHELQTLFSQ